jgi:hypothetical protein
MQFPVRVSSFQQEERAVAESADVGLLLRLPRAEARSRCAIDAGLKPGSPTGRQKAIAESRKRKRRAESGKRKGKTKLNHEGHEGNTKATGDGKQRADPSSSEPRANG